MNQSTATTPDIPALLAALENTPEGMSQVFGPDEPWYVEHQDVWVRPVSDFRDEELTKLRALLNDHPSTLGIVEHIFADFYDLTGRKIPWQERGSEWWEANVALNTYPDTRVYTRHPNSVQRFGVDYLIVGRGHYYLAAETDEGFEFVTGAVAFARHKAEEAAKRAAFLEANPRIESMTPWWANDLDIGEFDDVEGDDEVWVSYSHNVDADDLYLTQEASYHPATKTLKFETPYVSNGTGHIRPDRFAKLGGQLHELAFVLTRLGAEHSEVNA